MASVVGKNGVYSSLPEMQQDEPVERAHGTNIPEKFCSTCLLEMVYGAFNTDWCAGCYNHPQFCGCRLNQAPLYKRRYKASLATIIEKYPYLAEKLTEMEEKEFEEKECKKAERAAKKLEKEQARNLLRLFGIDERLVK